MKITVKKLQGGECGLDVLPTTSISEIKRQVSDKLGIPIDEQKLLLVGRTLADDQTIQSYPAIKEGTKLNLVVKKPESLADVSVRHFKKIGMSDIEALNAANKLLMIAHDKFNKLSWDDVERLCMDCLLDESGQKKPVIDTETECDDMFGL